MKAIKTLFLLLAAGLLFAGCSQDMYVQGTEMNFYDYDVRSDQWQLWGDAYCATLEVPAITQDILRNGNVQVSRCYPGGIATEDVWTPLPSMRTEVTEGIDGGDFYFTTFIDYEWTVRTVNIFVTTSDLYTEEVPASMSFRVIITR